MDSHRHELLNIDDTPAPVGSHVFSLAICIPTFHSPDGLQRLLESIKGQQFRKALLPEMEIFIVDNDPDASGKHVAELYKQSLPFPVHYHIEEKRGIPFVRNRLVELASQCDLIAFIDDDEEAEPYWLDELLYVQAKFQAPVVTGPVLARFETDPPAWAVAGKFYESVRVPNGSSRPAFFTGNLLIRSSLFLQLPKPFEESMALSGGTDYLLSLKLIESGVRIIWADDAIVYEYIPARRLRLQWYFRRQMRVGGSYVMCWRLAGIKRPRIKGLLKAARLFLLGPITIASSIIRGSEKLVKGMGYIFQGIGLFVATFNWEPDEYGRVDYRILPK